MLRILAAAAVATLIPVQALAQALRPETTTISDPARNRDIPVAIYALSKKTSRPLVVLSHGKGIKNTEYDFLAVAMAERGYVVASIQHDLPGDPPTPNTGNIPRDRTPGWQSQVASIRAVAHALARSNDYRFAGRPVLIGHSNGGDASMMAARDYPADFSAAMSFDNRRFALPRTAAPRICSLRSSDQRADPGVLPMTEERSQFDIRIFQAQNLRHDDMWDGATEAQKAQMLDAVWACLKD